MKKIVIVALLMIGACVFAEDAPAQPAKKLTIAVMDFSASGVKREAGGQIADLIAATLSLSGQVQVVERKELKKLRKSKISAKKLLRQ